LPIEINKPGEFILRTFTNSGKTMKNQRDMA